MRSNTEATARLRSRSAKSAQATGTRELACRSIPLLEDSCWGTRHAPSRHSHSCIASRSHGSRRLKQSLAPLLIGVESWTRCFRFFHEPCAESSRRTDIGGLSMYGCNVNV